MGLPVMYACHVSHIYIFYFQCFSIIVENFSTVSQFPTVFQDHAALASTLSVSSPKKTNIEEHNGGKNNDLKNAHHSGKTAKHDSSKHDETSAKKGQTTHTHKTTEDEEKSGKKHSSHDSANHSKHHHNANHEKHQGKYSDGHKAKKTNLLKGYRQQYHKHERKNHDSFWNNGEKKGNYEKFGSAHHKKHGEFRKKSAKHTKGEKGESNSYANKKTYKIEKPAHNHDGKQHLKLGNLQPHSGTVIKK
ncbi:uncharacterized protein DDB_G0283357-like [Chrysoperla carnea]|uniref:uncharacterized protein DDB_G0283357-like n=1 Tax=Chrysoperla carnea TaxID=189513 RepID=UPI001D063F9A|nr:uncharacterized protein DDB_G0283357-like [Chrysoperla carnea]